MADIKITAERRESIPVDLVGVSYEVTPPKTALAIKVALQAKKAQDDPDEVMKALDGWIARAFGKKQAAKITERLYSDEDDLDIDHIMQLMNLLMEESTGTPTS